MRAFLLVAALTAVIPLAASAQEGPDARAAYVERRGLIEVDTVCRVFQPSVRSALQVGVSQARGSLLRAGWSNAQVRELEQTVVGAARARTCNDPRTAAAAAAASRSFAQWANAGSMDFPGWERTWTARRTAEGWRLSQHIDAPISAMFGVRQQGEAQHLALAVPLARNVAGPSSAQLVMRDQTRTRVGEVSLNQRIAYGLEAGAPSATNAVLVPSTRAVERLEGGRSQIVFTFPDTAFRDLLTLDPRETVEIRLVNGRVTQRLLVEVGDIAAGRAFLTLRR